MEQNYGPCTLLANALLYAIRTLTPESVQALKKKIVNDRDELWDAVLNKAATAILKYRRSVYADRVRNDCWSACREADLDGGTSSVMQQLAKVVVVCDCLGGSSTEVTAPFLEEYLDWLLERQPADHRCQRGLSCDGCVAMAALLLRRGGELAIAGAASLLGSSDAATMMLQQLPPPRPLRISAASDQ